MEVIARSQNVRISPRKARMIAGAVKNLTLEDARVQLGFLAKNGAEEIKKILESALANAQADTSIDKAKLRIKNIFVDEGVKMKRMAKGRKFTSPYGRGIKQIRTSHIKVVLEA